MRAVARRAGARDGRGDVRAVAVLVGGDLFAGHEALRVVRHAALKVGVGVVVAGVEHGDGDALAGVSLGPRLGRVDERHARVERGLDLAVEVDRFDSARERRPGRERGDAGRQRGPRRSRVRVAERRGGAADARQRCLHLEARERRGERGRAAVLLDDDRRRVDGRVVVAVLDEHRDVEQVLVEQTRGDVGHRDVRDDVVFAVDLVRADAGAGLRRLDVDGVRAVGQIGHGHAITGDQRDGVRAAGGRGSGGGLFPGE